MTATNIDIEQFITVLMEIHNSGVRMMNLDMIPDDNHPSMNKLIIHPIKDGEDGGTMRRDRPNKVVLRNPKIDPNSDDIFNALNNL